MKRAGEYQRWGVMVVLVAGLAMATGCRSQSLPTTAGRAPQTQMDTALGRVLDPQRLRSDVSSFTHDLMVDVINAANTIAAASPEPSVREAAVRAKIRMSTAVQNVRQERDPRLSYLFAWLLVEQSLYHLTEGRGAALFGEQQPVMVEVITNARRHLLDVGRTHFPDVNMDDVQEEVLAMARRYVTQHQTFSSSYDASFVERQQDKNAVTSLLSIPMVPVSALGGVGDMPTAVERAAQQVQQTNQIIRDLPERVRWQFELAMLQLDQYQTITRTLAEIEATRQSLDRIAATAEQLPGSLRQEVEAALAVFQDSQPQWRQTIGEATRTLEQTTAALEQASATLGETDRVRDALTPLFREATQTAEAWREVVAAIAALTEADPDAPQREPVTVAEVSEAARQARDAAVELRALLMELRAPISPDSGLVQLSSDWQATINAMTWRLAGLIVLAFVLALIYAAVAARLRTGKRG